MAANSIRRLIDLGVIDPNQLSDSDLTQLGINDMPQPRYDIAPMQQNTLRVENGPDAGKVVPIGQPSQEDMLAAMRQAAQQKFAQSMPNLDLSGQGGPRIMPQGGGPGTMRVVGSGGGAVVDLGTQQAQPVSLDYSRGKIDIPGVGRGYYGKDGNAYVQNPDGSITKALLGYDMQGSMALNAADLKRRQGEAQIAHTQEQIRASQINNPDLGTVGAAVAGGPTGEDFLKTLDPLTAGQVKAYAEGRIPLPAGFALKSPYFQNMLRLVGQYDPSFDVANAPARVATRKSFTSGPDAANVTAIETAINHLGGLFDAYKQLDNSGVPLYNTVANAVENSGLLPGSSQNQAATAAVQSHALAVAHELASVFRRTGMSNKEVDDWLNQVSTSASPATANSVISNAVDLLYGRLGPLADKYNQGMGTTGEPVDLLKPGPRAVLQKLQAANVAGQEPHAVVQSDQSAIPASGSAFVNIPQGAIAMLKAEPWKRTAFDMKYGAGSAAKVLGQ